MNKNTRSRNFDLILYPDDETHLRCISLLDEKRYQYCGILHNADTDYDGSLKKEHFHIVLTFDEARYHSAVAKELGITENYIQICRSKIGSLRYLCHLDNPDKFQYDKALAFGPLASSLANLCVDTDENGRVLHIMDLISQWNGVITLDALIRVACKNGLYGDLRRMGYWVKMLIEDHNLEYQNRKEYCDE